MPDSERLAATERPPWVPTVEVLLIVALVLGAISVFMIAGMAEPEVLPGLVTVPAPLRDHDNAAVIPEGERPPAGGVHPDIWLNCGVYREPVDAAQANHALEHGAVWITYRDDLPPAEIAALEQRYWRTSHIIISPYPSQRSPIVLTAWAVQLEVEAADDGRIETFVDHYRLGATAPESGGACSGGAGEPLN